MPNFTPIPINFYSKTTPAGTNGTGIPTGSINVGIPGIKSFNAGNAPVPNINLQSLAAGFGNQNNNSGPSTTISRSNSSSGNGSNSSTNQQNYSYGVQNTNPSTLRLANNGLPFGGTYSSGQVQPSSISGSSSGSSSTGSSSSSSNSLGSSSSGNGLSGSVGMLDFSSGGPSDPNGSSSSGGGNGWDSRVKIIDKTGTMGKTIIFPYTPVITISHKANYELENLIHSTYSTPYYTHSAVDSINVQGRFTAQTVEEAQYVRDMIQFFRTATKMFYGASKNRGAPPPVVTITGYGSLIDNIPVVVRDFTYSLPNDVNYISSNDSSIPTDMTITVDLTPVYSRNEIAGFDISSYAGKTPRWI